MEPEREWPIWDDAMLYEHMQKDTNATWDAISAVMHRSKASCVNRREDAILSALEVNPPFLEKEDSIITKQAIRRKSSCNWSIVAKDLDDRSEPQTMLRWISTLRGTSGERPTLPKAKRSYKKRKASNTNPVPAPSTIDPPFTQEEELVIIELMRILNLGNCWTAMSSLLPGCSEDDIKNHWMSNLRTLHDPAQRRPNSPPPTPGPTSSSTPLPPPGPSSPSTTMLDPVDGMQLESKLAMLKEFRKFLEKFS